CAEGNAVSLAGPLLKEKVKIVFGTDDAWQAEQRLRWIVRMNAQTNPKFFGHRANSAQKSGRIGTECHSVYVPISVKSASHLIDAEGSVAARQALQDGAEDAVALRLTYALVKIMRGSALFRRPVIFGSLAPEPVDVESRESIGIEARGQ